MKNKTKKENVKHNIKKVVILGSGAIKIGQAGEFDYSGSQAIKAMKEEGIRTVLINPNIATIQTSEALADEIYFIPITAYTVEQVIKKEKPDGILLAFGGQTALNCGVQLKKRGTLKKYKVKVLGTPVESIEVTEDRELFKRKLKQINAKTPKSISTQNVKQALAAAKKLGYPVMARVAYALGGLGSGVCYTEQALKEKCEQAFSKVPQILIEEYLEGWKEIEYEIVRDSYDNCITVCNMENFDPMGIHTGESIVVAPSQTLTNNEYHMLREVAIRVIRHLGIIGECNIQYAFDPNSEDYRIIEVNARLSRSSALASKATGYPLAFVAAKLGLGMPLTEVRNSITLATKACFEPALDYIVVKIPRWDLQKFWHVKKEIGSEMKSVGEVMAIGRNFEETLQKALRMLGTGMQGLVCNGIRLKDLDKQIKNPTDERVFAIAEALKRRYSIDKLYSLSHIDKWFLHKLKNIIETEKKVKKAKKIGRLDKKILLQAKQHGFSDMQIAVLLGIDELKVRNHRQKAGIMPFIKQIDTLAAEYPARTNYLYLTYNASEDDIAGRSKEVMVLGSGAYRIGSSVEFDWCCVNAVLTLRKLGHKTIMLNYNPETVSTDYDICDKLFFDEISFEAVMDIYEKQGCSGIILSMGGQIPNNLALRLHKQKAKVLGTSPVSIDNAEDRHKFSSLLDRLKIDQPEWRELTTIKEAKRFALKVGYPVLIRPSYVLSGAAMSIALNQKSLEQYLEKASDVSKEHPVVVSKFITEAKEIEIDAVANRGSLVCWAISEHVENAGVHSGDATMVLPPQRLYLETSRRIKKIAKTLAKHLNITGPFNMQFIAKNNKVKVIELNLRSSRSFPFVSKVFKLNFIDLATKAMLNKKIPKIERSAFELDYVGCKAPQFSFARLRGSDPRLSVEMASTGEVACFGDDIYEAFLKAFISVGYRIPKKNILLSTGTPENKADLLHSCIMLNKMGYKLYATRGTHAYLRENSIPSIKLNWPLDRTEPNAVSFIKTKKIDFVINIPKSHKKKELSNGYLIRRAAIDYNIPLVTNTQLAKLFIRAISLYREKDLKIKAWGEYGE
ncbi:carbamoyl-phosphate synthase (glutamine-hydrolyzing) large subunit [Candidatus Woesearchaeota archaeon]|nr:carbamoyl-phosphate synthase (glutamine-hydrolyzing) large subunit [Candidatus Woesearchaeota archaeon]